VALSQGSLLHSQGGGVEAREGSVGGGGGGGGDVGGLFGEEDGAPVEYTGVGSARSLELFCSPQVYRQFTKVCVRVCVCVCACVCVCVCV